VLTSNVIGHIDRNARLDKCEQLVDERRKQPGIECPLAGDQTNLLIIRLNLARRPRNPGETKDPAQIGLQRLCGLFERINNGEKAMDEFNSDGLLVRKNLVKDFNFSATIGFGKSFFDQLNIADAKRPKRLREMPDHSTLGDPSPFSLAQTDLIIQLGSTQDHINRWVLENTVQAEETQIDDNDPRKDCPGGVNIGPNKRCCPDGQIVETPTDPDKPDSLCTPDIRAAIEGWATITDVNAGFQRMDGRNLMGFNDGVSNPTPGSGPPFDNVVWINQNDTQPPDPENPLFIDGTYMVFQKIEHDLSQWRTLPVEVQEEWVGRSKGTGLLKGTLSDEDDEQLGSDLNSPDKPIREAAEQTVRDLIKPQRDPLQRFYDQDKFKNNVAAWAHIRKANPREEQVVDKVDPTKKGRISAGHIIFRRGYLFSEIDENNKVRSGLQFVCFQRSINQGFQFLKHVWLNNKNFPVPSSGASTMPNLFDVNRDFTQHEFTERHKRGRFTLDELNNLSPQQRQALGLDDPIAFGGAIAEAKNADTQNVGREGLEGPSELGVKPAGDFLAIVPFGGGYYLVPPIMNKSIKNIGQQFFTSPLT
jgi:Dyp-type peroxidase family